MLCVGMCIDKMRCFSSCPPILAFTFTTKHADQNTESPVSNVNGNELNLANRASQMGSTYISLDCYILIFEISIFDVHDSVFFLVWSVVISPPFCVLKKTRQNRHLRLHCCKLLLYVSLEVIFSHANIL